MAYPLIALAGIILVAVIAVAFRRRKPADRPTEANVTVAEPAADEPTPGLSQTASNPVARNVDRKTPPA